MSTIATQRKPINISYVDRLVRYYPTYAAELTYLRVFLRDNPNSEGMVTIVGTDWQEVARWMSNNPNHPEVSEIRVLTLVWKPCRQDVTVIKNNVVMTLDSLMTVHDRESDTWKAHEFTMKYSDRYPQHC